ncbi:MAG: hypothetical protein ACLUW6_00465 [Coriobacteriaceae bacterium]
MATYIAHYQSPKGSYERARAVRVRERRAGRHQGQRPRRAHEDARAVRREAVSCTIEKVERAGAAPAEKREKTTDGQLALDFRPPKPERKRKHSKGYW